MLNSAANEANTNIHYRKSRGFALEYIHYYYFCKTSFLEVSNSCNKMNSSSFHTWCAFWFLVHYRKWLFTLSPSAHHCIQISSGKAYAEFSNLRTLLLLAGSSSQYFLSSKLYFTLIMSLISVAMCFTCRLMISSILWNLIIANWDGELYNEVQWLCYLIFSTTSLNTVMHKKYNAGYNEPLLLYCKLVPCE